MIVLIFLALAFGACVASQDPNPPSLLESPAFISFQQDNLGKYNNSHFLNAHVVVYWNLHLSLIDSSEDYIEIVVASDATGWVGFGISDAGGMRGADMVIYETATDTIADYYSMDYERPQLDDCANSWTQLNTWMDTEETTNGEFIAFQATRALDTNDKQDWPIFPLDGDPSTPPTIIIAAYGNTPTLQFHGRGNSVRSAVRFHGDSNAKSNVDFLREQSDGSLFIKASNVTVPVEESHYELVCVDLDDLFAQQGVNLDTIHVVGLDHSPSLKNNGVDTTGLVHHFLVTGLATRCAEGNSLKRTLYVWAPGQDPLVFPTNVSMPLGSDSSYKALLFELHYTNLAGVVGVVDDTSVEIFYVNERRTHDAAVFTIGSAPDSFGIDGTPIPTGQSYHDFACRPECFLGPMGSNPVSVFAEGAHMHLNGARFRSTVTNTETGETTYEGRIDVWDYDQNGIKLFQFEPLHLSPVVIKSTWNAILIPAPRQTWCLVRKQGKRCASI